MTSPTPFKYNGPQTSKPLGQQSSSSRSYLETHLEHDKDTASQSFLLNYIQSKFHTFPDNLRLRGGVGGYHPNSRFPNRVTIIINIPPNGANENQEEGDSRGLNLGLLKQGTEIFKQGNELLKSVKDEKALMENAYGTAKEMFLHEGAPKFDANTMNQGFYLLENVNQQRNKIHDIVGNAKEITDSLGIDIKTDPHEAIDKLKKGYEAYQAVEKMKSNPLSMGNIWETGGSLLQNLGVGSRSAHISDSPLQSVGNNTCPPCPRRGGRGGVGVRSENIPETDVQKETLDRPNFAHLKRLLDDFNFKVDMEMKKCMRAYKTYEENPNMSPEEMSELKVKIKCCGYKYRVIEGQISRLLANLT